MYVHGAYKQRGIGSMFLRRLFAQAAQADLSTLTVVASECSRPLLMCLGFAVVDVEVVERGNVQF